jgi:hypothetical protein
MLSRTELLAQLAAHPEYSCPPQVSASVVHGWPWSVMHVMSGTRGSVLLLLLLLLLAVPGYTQHVCIEST